MEFCEYETTYNTDISNKFQYTEFNKYKESETVEINISELINQNTSTEFNIKFSVKMQNVNSFNAFQNVSSETMNTSIASHCSECNQQSTHYQKDEFYYDPIHKIKILQYIAFISAITLPVNGDSKNLYKAMICEN